eukprot:scaffold12556_cov44-Cyclotella_meneghiniana.AAC.3
MDLGDGVLAAAVLVEWDEWLSAPTGSWISQNLKKVESGATGMVISVTTIGLLSGAMHIGRLLMR